MPRFNRPLLLVCSTVLLMLICGVISATSEPGERVYDFLFRRSIVQFATLAVFCLVATLLLRRLANHVRQRMRFASLLAHQGKEIRARLEKDGIMAAELSIRSLAEEDEEHIRKGYEFINFAICVLPALGLFGTVLGLSGSLFQAFAGGSEDIDSMRQFVAALGTALDTTVLAMICALPAFGGAWLLARQEMELCRARHMQLRKRFGLGESAYMPPPSPPSDPAATADHLRADVRALVSDLGQTAKAAFEQILQSAEEAYRQKLDRAIQSVLKQQWNHERRMVERLAEQLGDGVLNSMGDIRKSIEKQNGHSAKLVVCQLKKLEKALRRNTPDEVTIRFDHGDAQGEDAR